MVKIFFPDVKKALIFFCFENMILGLFDYYLKKMNENKFLDENCAWGQKKVGYFPTKPRTCLGINRIFCKTPLWCGLIWDQEFKMIRTSQTNLVAFR